ncbi:sensor histidine kinase [Thermomonospora umbrina]|uniref:histidine kinase n=1 Tax=Thermomonospora umbrina TaxID=111806 RepID=A0A3D9SZB2_9ACTN|nr:histidine kinase [Thermomonospora umbrina]REE99393.1 histidine kinase [Thermomonospora umbrina]
MRIWLSGGLMVLSVAVGLASPVPSPYRGPDVPGVVLCMLAALCLLWLRSHPLRVLIAACAALLVNAAAGYPGTLVHWPLWIALFGCFAEYGDARRRAVCGAVFATAFGGFLLLDRDPFDSLPGIAMGLLITTFGGDALHSRRAYTAESAARVLLEERARLARELHDAVGHSVNVMVMQAAVGQRVFDGDPAFGHDALRHIEALGRSALTELDRLVHALDDPSAMVDLQALADRVRAAGRELDLDVGAVDLEPDGANALNRIIQEAVTNALRHTEAGRIRLSLAQSGGRVRLEVLSEGSGPTAAPSGRGLANMRHRAALQGGALDAGPTDDGFLVRATLPARS